jgi:Tol biopolymer transport system component
MDRGQKRSSRRGAAEQSALVADGSKIAFVTDRGNHAFIAIYDGSRAV